jgi:hypothetical protein
LNSDDEEIISDNRSIWSQSGAERSCFPFAGKPGINVDLEDTSSPLEYFELFYTQEIEGSNSPKTNQCAQKFLENTPNLKLISRTHH